MKKAKNWRIALLDYLCTPISGVKASPMELMQNRTVRSLLPCIQRRDNTDHYEHISGRRDKQAMYHDRSSHALPALAKGSNVYFYSRQGTWEPATVVDRVHDRSYTLVTANGQVISRNRVDIKPNPHKVQHTFQTGKPKAIPNNLKGASKGPASGQVNNNQQLAKAAPAGKHVNKQPWVAKHPRVQHANNQSQASNGNNRGKNGVNQGKVQYTTRFGHNIMRPVKY